MPRLTRVAMIPVVVAAIVAAGAPAVAKPAADARFTEQRIDWHPCEEGELPSPPPPAADQLECGTYQAPRDWNNPDEGPEVTIAVSKLPASSGTASRSILTNPGGPGAPGRAFPVRLRNQERVREFHDVIGVDPRGTGKSSNITCGGAVSSVDPLDPRDRGEENIDLILDTTEAAADACQQKSGELGPFINTFQTVRDLDLLRELLGREKISWLGYSAGTWLGAHYATAFPGRVDRFVLDSNVDFTTDWQRSFDWQPLGFERRWRADFLPWLAKHHDFYDFGRTSQRARLNYEEIRAELQDEPVELDGEEIGPNEFDTQIIGAMYNKRAFVGLGEYLVAVRDLVDDNVTGKRRTDALATLSELHKGKPAPGPRPLVVGADPETGYDDAYDASFWSIPCNETAWTGDSASVVAQSDEFGKKYPLLGWSWLIQPCIFWEDPPIALPTPTGQGVPPVLMVQSTNDPATPLEGARRAHTRFDGSRMLTVTNEGDHGLYAAGNDCVDEIVEDYLVAGVVPEDSRCEGTPLPEPEEEPARAPERGVPAN